METQLNFTFEASSFLLVNYLFGTYFLGVALLSLWRAYQSFNQSTLNEGKQIQVKQQEKQYLGAIYYTIMSILCILYGSLMVSFWSYNKQYIDYINQLSTKDEDEAHKVDHYYYNELYICDCLFLILFLLILTQLILYEKFAFDMRSSVFQKALQMAIKFDVPKQRLYTILIYLAIQIAIIVIYNITSQQNFDYQGVLLCIDLFWNSIQPLTLMIYYFYRIKIYQGKVIRSLKYEKDISQLYYLLTFFCFGRILTCLLILSILIPLFEDHQYVYPSCLFQQNNNNSYNMLQLVTHIIVLTICLLLPFLASLLNTYKKILMIRFKQESLISLDQNIDLTQISLQQNLIDNDDYRSSNISEQQQVHKLSITDYTDKTIIQINIDEVVFNDNLQSPSISQVQLGSLQKGLVKNGKYANKEFLIRKIVVKKLSQYIIEEMNQNIQGYRNLSCRFIQPIKAIAFHQENVHFFVPFFENGNINSLILSKDIIPDQDKKKITIQICIGMNYLYQQNPPVPHGHLIPNNIMITKSKDIKIIDFGLAPMKKYISLTTGYSTKCQYTAPELLKERSQTPLTNQAADIYSFGLIIWEIYHQKQAFLGLQLQELQKIVCDDKKRPKINDQVDEDIQNIIRACWQDEIDQRPTFDKVLSILNGTR